MNSNPWRTAVLTVLAIVLGIFAWRFLTGASSDLQALFVGIGFGAVGAYGVGYLMGRGSVGATRLRAEEYEEAFESGHAAGVRVGWHAAITEDGVCEVVVPQQARELVPVRR